jgi:hypothetical protein
MGRGRANISLKSWPTAGRLGAKMEDVETARDEFRVRQPLAARLPRTGRPGGR